MGRQNKFKKILSKLPRRQIIGLCLGLAVASCSTSKNVRSIEKVKQEQALTTEIKIETDFLDDIRMLSLPGSNFISSLHPSGDRLLFFSSNRIAHKKFQVYEYDFKTEKERRVTHQNGHAFHASYHPNGQHIIYSSTTDFEKEDLRSLFQFDSEDSEAGPWRNLIPALKSDLYISRLNGTNIIRATYIDSAEQFPIYHPKDYTIVYKLSREGSQSIEQMSRYRKPLEPLSLRNENHSFLDISTSGKNLAWVQYDEDKGFFLHTMNWKTKKKQVKEIPGLVSLSSLSWISDKELIITAQKDGDEVPAAYYLDSDITCIKKIASSKYGIQNANSLKNNFVMTAFTGTHWQIIQAKMKPGTSCVEKTGNLTAKQ